ncbi:tetratricopeptide repeat protein [Commensalibacter oyaizuii]|uniref:Tetratricopeptide repeat protein n=1 Tax=Commensalibacter oyaizuii TaxID=3043873 RepID=A0ABT6Q5K1_9PROT|nr:tetratricopeptide repeat protein [Commensalibacter sp. TBRC 16381]MDI2091739.1 tetratricopeptide repeat protein [Commensalibacter sp. TBRC 16381]
MRKIFYTLLITVGLIGFTGSSYAENSAVFTQMEKLANEGNGQAQHNLGVMYQRGIGTIQNDAKAIEWYTKAADQGVVRAQNNLGMIYKNGKGVEKNYAKAIEWFTKAAEYFQKACSNKIRPACKLYERTKQ